MSNENERQVNEKQEPKKERKKAISTLNGVICSNVGSPVQPVYKRVYDKELDRSLVTKVDTFNIQEFIQASKSQTDLALLQKRFIELGELPPGDPSMGSNDLANMPQDIHGVYAMVNDVAGNFAKLPQSIQDIFGSKEVYLEAILKGTYQSTLINALNTPKAEVKKESEVITNE